MHLRPSTALAAGALALLCSDLTSQGKNATLLGTLTPAPGGVEYSDIWGYVDPATGSEYAILGSEIGTHIIDCTNPAAPVQTALIPRESSGSYNIWRDFKTVGPYAYGVTEEDGGMQIIDLHNPNAPFKVTNWGASLWTNAHNIGIDEGTGLLYVCGTNNGTHVIDVSSPASPSEIFRLANPYVHDLSVQDGYGYLADLNGNNLLIVDVSQLPSSMPQVASVKAPGSKYCHNTWPTRDDQYCLTTNETEGAPVGFYDVSNKRNPLLISQYRTGPSRSIPHNGFFRDRVAHISYYTEGYRAVDLSDPMNPVEVGYYDTSTSTAGNYLGAWGVWDEAPSGNIFISDIVNGLYVVKPKATSTLFGQTTTGTSGLTPEIHTHGSAYLGNSRFAVLAEKAAASRPGVLVLGVGRQSLVFGGLAINVQLTGAAIVPVSTDAQGAVRVPVPVQNDPSLAGAVLDVQFVITDSAAPMDLSGTQGLEFELFTP